ncbi:MAG: iron-containing alcohol dehydrogenase [Lachnospiraceae bacterium]|nr:iron-containing alcohol dehydrogenase [Lachnospiraceae bacterium]
MKIIIIGSAATGLEVAKSAVSSYGTQICIYEKGSFVQTKGEDIGERLLADADGLNADIGRCEDYLKKSGAEVHTLHEVTGIDPLHKTVEVMDKRTGMTFADNYDKLIIATGSHYEVPNVPGSGKMGVHVLKTTEDLLFIREFIKTPYVKDIVVLGTDAHADRLADAFARKNRNVRVIDTTMESIKAFDGRTFVERIVTVNGSYACDLCIASDRLIPDTKLVCHCGIEMTSYGEIIVNERNETSVKDIFAAGSCACKNAGGYVRDSYARDSYARDGYESIVCGTMSEDKAVTVNAVKTTFFGKGAVRKLIPELKGRGYERALVVTDGFLAENGAAKRVGDVLIEAGIEYAVYSGVQPNPTVKVVNECIKTAGTIKADILVAVGGGSAIDTAKAVSIVVKNGGRVEQYEGVNKSKAKGTPIVAINTTAGTGSECTSFYIVTDPVRHSKMTMVDKNCMVDIAVNDIDFMMSMPPKLTASTGMDALTHAIEAYLSVNANPVTDKDAYFAMETVFKYLPRAVRNGSDEEARTMMAYAQNVAGEAFSNAGLGMVHAMAHALGGFYNLPHGVCNAVLLPYVMEFNASDAGVCDKLINVCNAFGLEVGNDPVHAASQAIAAIHAMNRVVGIPKSLSELEKVKPTDFRALASLAVRDTCMRTNPIRATEDMVVSVYERAFS